MKERQGFSAKERERVFFSTQKKDELLRNQAFSLVWSLFYLVRGQEAECMRKLGEIQKSNEAQKQSERAEERERERGKKRGKGTKQRQREGEKGAKKIERVREKVFCALAREEVRA